MDKCPALKDSFVESENLLTIKPEELIALESRAVVSKKGASSLLKQKIQELRCILIISARG